MLFDKFVAVEERVLNGANYSYQPVAGLALVPINIQPMRAEFSTDKGMSFKYSKAFVTNSGIVEDMRLTETISGKQYIVRGRESFDYFAGQHYELILEADKK